MNKSNQESVQKSGPTLTPEEIATKLELIENKLDNKLKVDKPEIEFLLEHSEHISVCEPEGKQNFEVCNYFCLR